MIRDLMQALRATTIFLMVTAVIYPAIVLCIGQVMFTDLANGSLLFDNNGQIIGSSLIGQEFTSDRYFWSRPSTVNYSEGKENAPMGQSGASNLAPSNPLLSDRIEGEIQRLKRAGVEPTADLVYTSGSGLDPHISVRSALVQIERVARSRSLDLQTVKAIVDNQIEERFLGIFGEPRVNVLKLNLALDRM
jgi:K+-transporting ATPase ATPase C chain